ncbi:MAG: DUF3488 domain-containing protein [Geobacter sp.]|nr:DUF3488 domain-containing protein [Geobacter sp.]
MVSIKFLASILTYSIGLCGLLPLFPWLTSAPRLALLLGLAVGLWQDFKGNWPFKTWMQNGAIVPVFLYYAIQFSRANPVQPVVSILAIMLAVRLAGEKTVRHSLQIQALSLFCLASSSLFDLSPIFLLYLGLMLFLVAIALVLLTFQDQENSMLLPKRDLRKVLIAGGLMPLLSLPLLLFFFPILPRTQMPLWNFLSSPTVRTSGYSDKVEPGVQPNAGESRALAFRAEMGRQTPQRLYWRGSVFNTMQGNRWVRADGVPPEVPVFSGPKVDQLIYPELSVSRVMIGLDRPTEISLNRLKRSPDGVFEYSGSLNKHLNYRASSAPDGLVAVKGAINKPFYTKLPVDISPRITGLAAEIVKAVNTDREKIDLLENYFRNGGYRYSMTGLPTGPDALEQFLFIRKQGHCEFFASAFAVLLRSAGVPCRLVGGFKGGNYSELGGYYLVSDDMAHVWVEAYIEGNGWQRIDPSSFAANAGEVWNDKKSRSLILRMKLTLDYLNYEWNRSVIVYDFEQQFEYARKAGKRLQGINPANILRNIFPYVLAIALLIALLFVVRRTSLFNRREERILKRFLRKVEKEHGISVERGELGLFEIAERADNQRVSEFSGIYAGALYRDRRLTDDEYRRLQQILREGF